MTNLPNPFEEFYGNPNPGSNGSGNFLGKGIALLVLGFLAGYVINEVRNKKKYTLKEENKG